MAKSNQLTPLPFKGLTEYCDDTNCTCLQIVQRGECVVCSHVSSPRSKTSQSLCEMNLTGNACVSTACCFLMNNNQAALLLNMHEALRQSRYRNA